ncbi:MAG: DUF86 domain-containing protein [Candidatus Aenigmatarchaeota archaeon]
MVPKNLSVYEKDFKTKAACERYVGKIIEAITDIAVLVIKEKGFELPENELIAFDILRNNNIILPDFTEKLKDAKRMRNIIAHYYGKVDDEIIFNSIKNELIKDAKAFIRAIR